MVFLLFT